MRGVVICPDVELNEQLEQVLNEIGTVSITRTLDHYPTSTELIRFLRAHAPQVIFVAIDSMKKVIEIVRDVDKNTPGVQLVAVSRRCDPELLLELMRAGIREFVSLPFDLRTVAEALARVEDSLKERPPEIHATDRVFSFLPSKGGVGTSTIAVNTSIALSRMAHSSVLLSDFDLNSGMIRFMLKVQNPYCVTDAAEHSVEMDENQWPRMITAVDKLDVLHAGRVNPDFRIEPTQIRHLLEFMRRNYRILCFDLSGNLEKYSLEIMHESKRIYLVCTPEIPSLHLAREKYLYLKQLDLSDRVTVLLNRCQKRPLLSSHQIEELLGLPVEMTFPNDYNCVHRALESGGAVEPASQLGKQFTLLAEGIAQAKAPRPISPGKKRFIEFFSIVPAKYTVIESQKPGR